MISPATVYDVDVTPNSPLFKAKANGNVTGIKIPNVAGFKDLFSILETLQRYL